MLLCDKYKVHYYDHLANNEDFLEEKILMKKRAVDNLLWNLFARSIAIKGNQEIVVIGHVIYDGQGDWLAMVNVCKHLQKKFPDRIVRLIATSEEVHKNKLQDSKLKALNLIFSANGRSAELSEFPAEWEILEKIQNAALVFIGPIDPWRLLEKTGKEIMDKAIAFNEYDACTNFYPASLKVNMGLAKDAVGIFTKSMRKKDEWTWNSLENDNLKQILFNDSNPNHRQVDEYLLKNELFFAYMKTKSFCRFICDAITYANANVPTKSIDICFRCKGKIEELENELPWQKLRTLGIGSAEIIFYENDQMLKYDFELAKEGKKIKIFDVGNLSIKDFKKIMFLSAPLVGVTGDNSLAQAIGKIPFYECPRHKKKFIDNLAQLIDEGCGSAGGNLSNYIKATANEDNSEETEKFISQPQLLKQAEIVREIIQKNFSVNSIFKGIANHQLLKNSNPEYVDKEDSLRKEYLESKITIQQLEESIKEELLTIKLLVENNEI